MLSCAASVCLSKHLYNRTPKISTNNLIANFLYRPLCFAILLLVINTSVIAQSANTATSPLLLGKPKLLERYFDYVDEGKITNNKVNFSITSLMENNISTGHAYSILEHSYSDIVSLLNSAENWCIAVIVNVNIKTCTYEHETADLKYLNLYVEDEHYVKPKNAYHIRYRYASFPQIKDYLYVKMDAKEGPYDTGDYLFIVEVIPLEENRSFIHLAYSAHFGLISRILLNTYLATIGRNKFGFTVVDQKKDGSPKYITGIKAIMERNTARYLLAFQSYLETLRISPENRLMTSLYRWHYYTKLFRPQLYELNEADYLSNKQKEFENQKELQSKLLID